MKAGFDGIVKAAVSAMQPSSVKLGAMQKRVARATREDGEDAAEVRREDILHAIAAAGTASGHDRADPFGRLSLRFGPSTTRGDPLGEILWRVKWVGERDAGNVTRASHLLIHRLGRGAKRRLSPTMQVIAVVALLEWLNDKCPACRGGIRPGARSAPPAGIYWCPACKSSDGVTRLTTTARAMTVGATLRSWVGGRGKGLDVAVFEEKWASRYEKVLEMLTAAERRLARSIDKQLRHSENGRTESDVEQDQLPDDEPDASSGTSGDVRPRESSKAA